LGRPGRVEFILDGLRWKKQNAPITPIRLLPGDSAPLVVINTELLEAEKKSTLEEEVGPVRKDQFPVSKKIQKRKIQKPTGEFESVNRLSSDSGRDIDEVKGAGGVVKAGERRNQIPLCVDEIRHHHFAVD